jgi:hypothetical protein
MALHDDALQELRDAKVEAKAGKEYSTRVDSGTTTSEGLAQP